MHEMTGRFGPVHALGTWKCFLLFWEHGSEYTGRKGLWQAVPAPWTGSGWQQQAPRPDQGPQPLPTAGTPDGPGNGGRQPLQGQMRSLSLGEEERTTGERHGEGTGPGGPRPGRGGRGRGQGEGTGPGGPHSHLWSSSFSKDSPHFSASSEVGLRGRQGTQ